MQKKNFLYLLFLPLAVHLFSLFFLHFGKNFHPKDFIHGFDKTYSKEVSGLDYSQLDEILHQPFHYLGQGKQMTALESADGKYVLKLFNPMRPLKHKWYMELKWWKQCSSLKWISREWFHKKERLEKLFKRHQLAYDHLREETGLLFVYLSPSEKISHYVRITDNRDKLHTLSLHNTPFVLQERATLVPQYLHELIESEKIDEANRAVERIEELFIKRLEFGITDRIQTMENNYGFVGEKPIQLDVGRIRIEPDLQESPNAEKARILGNFRSWLQEHYPLFTQ